MFALFFFSLCGIFLVYGELFIYGSIIVMKTNY